MKKKIEYIETNNELIEQIAKKFNISELVATILVNRGIIKEEEIKIFLEPTRDNFYNPFDLPDMEKAIIRIEQAIKKQEKVIIYGDYDVDGITSITVLKKFLEERGLKTDYYIPNRLDEGYGLNNEAIEKFAKEKYTLMITVDCGISGNKEVELANKIGIETIITDHHEPLDILPNAYAVIDPKREDNKYPFRHLAGVGVVFKLIQAISIHMKLEAKEFLKFLDIVCIGTISDIVPLFGENRVIAKLGMKLVEVTKNIGLRSLLKVSGYKEVSSTAISFGIAPRINACGRIGKAEEALKLFLTDDYEEARRITDELNRYNKERQEKEKSILIEALEKIEKENMKSNNTIVVSGENWHHGVIGIVASKITEIYYKPSILLSIEDNIAKGSGRSIEGFDLHNALCECNDLLEKYGGHEMAVGLSLPKSNLQKFNDKIQEISKDIDLEQLVPIIKIDKILTSKDLEIENIKTLKMLEPFGEGNKNPNFLIKNAKITSIRALSEGKHLKVAVNVDGKIIDVIGFKMGELVDHFLIGDKVDIAGTVDINVFNGNRTVQMTLKSMIGSVA